MKFKEGDRVRVRYNDQLIDKEYYDDSTSDMRVNWSDSMKRFIGKEFILTDRDCYGWKMHLDGSSCKFLEDWLEYADNTTDTKDKFNDAMSIL